MRKLLVQTGIALIILTGNVPKSHAFSVATGTQGSTEAAIDILRAGGNAVDAMIAASFTLNVTLPYAMGIGGGGFFLVSKNGKIYLWDHREMAPVSAKPEMFLKSNGKPINFYPERVTGPNPVGIPGTVAALYEAHRKLGRLPWKRLLQTAIKYAHDGFPTTVRFAEVLADEWDRMKDFPATAALYGEHDEGHVVGPLKWGHTLRNPMMAKTLETIAEKGAQEFYTGELARSWLAEAQKLGVKITLEDLKNYKVRFANPVEFRIFGLRAVTAAPPSGSGVMVAGTLRYIENYYKTHDLPPAGSAARIIVTTEALKYFQNLRNALLADEPWSKIDPRKYLGSAEEKAAWTTIDAAVKARLEKIQTKFTAMGASKLELAQTSLNAPRAPHQHTAHLSVVDDQGMAVSYTTTIEELFGSGLVVPGHGFLLNNELSDFTAEPGTPNSPAPGKRPRSNMSPVILLDSKNHPVGVVGSAGGPFIPSVIVQMLEDYHLHKMSAREAISFFRFHPDQGENKLMIEKSVPKSVVEQLKTAGYNVSVETFWSSAMALLRHDAREGWEAAAEPRTEGAGFSFDPVKVTR